MLVQLRDDGYRLVGPTVRDGAIVHDDIECGGDLPVGWTDEQGPGRYRLSRRDHQRRFDYRVGLQSWKSELFAPREKLFHTRRTADGSLSVQPLLPDPPPTAFIGVRACDLAAIGIQDKIFMDSGVTDPRYARRRSHALLIAVNCLEPGATCFCASTGTGPQARSGYDIVLTELDEHLIAEAGSEHGESVLAQLELNEASMDSTSTAERRIAAAHNAMGRSMDVAGLPSILFANLDHPRWDAVAERCLSCGNCTQACPTCFCHTVEDLPTLDPGEQERERRWDSCFTAAHGHLHGGAVRPRTRERYRQWLTHKLGSWESQFGMSGCVGCGRCISWCPVGIDLTEEVAAIRADGRHGAPLPPVRVNRKVAGDVMVPHSAIVRTVEPETDDAITLAIEPSGPFDHHHGQFNMLAVPGIGECAISISGAEGSTILHTVRGVGGVSRALTRLCPGDRVGLRGPFGRP